MTTLTLEQALTELKLADVPTDSVIRGAQHVNDLKLTTSQAQAKLMALTGEKVEGDHIMYAPLTYGYLVQNILKAHIAKTSAALVDLLVKSKAQANELIEKQAWMFIVDEDARQEIENADPAVVIAGKAKKGARKVLALKVFRDEIEGKELTRKAAIAILQEKVGLTAPGASTYYANFKSGKWA